MRIRPTLHDDFLINDRVSIKENSLNNINLESQLGAGEIIGVAYEHLFYTYIILLDKPFFDIRYNQ